MPYCEFCGDEIGYLPFKCKYCGGIYCKKHRLPENHECTFEMKIAPVVPDTRRDVRPMYTDTKIRRAPVKDSEYKRQREIQKYLRQQQKQRRRSERGFEKSLTGATDGTTYLIVLIVIFSLVAFFIPPFVALSLYGLYLGFYWVLITSIFVSYSSDLFGLLFLFILVFFLYNIARNIELRFGTRFLIGLYLFCTAFTAGCFVLLRLLLATAYPVSAENVIYVGLATGGILGLISFIVYFNPDQEMMLFCFFIPVRMKGRILVLLLILFRVIFGLMYGLFFHPLYFAVYLPDIGGILASYLVFYSKYKYR